MTGRNTNSILSQEKLQRTPGFYKGGCIKRRVLFAHASVRTESAPPPPPAQAVLIIQLIVLASDWFYPPVGILICLHKFALFPGLLRSFRATASLNSSLSNVTAPTMAQQKTTSGAQLDSYP